MQNTHDAGFLALRLDDAIENAIGTAALAVNHLMDATAKRIAFSIRPIGVSLLTILPASIRGGQTASGQVTLECPAPPGGLLVSRSSSLPSAAPPATVTVPAGATSASFQVATTFVTTSTTITLTASAGGSAQTATLMFLPDPPSAPPSNLAVTALSPTQLRLT